MSTDLRAKLFIFAFLFTLTIIGFSFYDFCLLNFKKYLKMQEVYGIITLLISTQRM